LKFKLDENIPDGVRRVLGARGLDVHTVSDEGLSGADDDRVLSACLREDRILVTLDLDFSDIRAYPPGSHPGIWVLRPPRQTFAAIAALTLGALELASMEWVAGHLWVIDDRRVRIRGGGP
jgi:predicted nuclease of predicted toxin-antitoxin system